MDFEKVIKKHFEDDEQNFKSIANQFLSLKKSTEATTKTLNHIAKELHRKKTPEEKVEEDKEFDDRIQASMKKAIYGTSKWAYGALLVTAVVVGSLITIFGGFKTILAWLGFTRM